MVTTNRLRTVNPAAITHQQRELLAQRVFALAAGYEDGNDHQALR